MSTLDTRAALRGFAMTLVSTDADYSGTVTDILDYRTRPGGGVDAVVLVDEPHAWYSRTHPVVVDEKNLHLTLTVQVVARTSHARGRR